MADNNSRKPQGNQPPGDQPEGTDPPGTPPQITLPPETSDPVRLVRGAASPEELSALIAVVAVLSAGGEHESGEGNHPAGPGGTRTRPQWNSPAQMVRATQQPGPGGWRASAYPR